MGREAGTQRDEVTMRRKDRSSDRGKKGRGRKRKEKGIDEGQLGAVGKAPRKTDRVGGPPAWTEVPGDKPGQGENQKGRA